MLFLVLLRPFRGVDPLLLYSFDVLMVAKGKEGKKTCIITIIISGDGSD